MATTNESATRRDLADLHDDEIDNMLDGVLPTRVALTVTEPKRLVRYDEHNPEPPELGFESGIFRH